MADYRKYTPLDGTLENHGITQNNPQPSVLEHLQADMCSEAAIDPPLPPIQPVDLQLGQTRAVFETQNF